MLLKLSLLMHGIELALLVFLLLKKPKTKGKVKVTGKIMINVPGTQPNSKGKVVLGNGEDAEGGFIAASEFSAPTFSSSNTSAAEVIFYDSATGEFEIKWGGPDAQGNANPVTFIAPIFYQGAEVNKLVSDSYGVTHGTPVKVDGKIDINLTAPEPETPENPPPAPTPTEPTLPETPAERPAEEPSGHVENANE